MPKQSVHGRVRNVLYDLTVVSSPGGSGFFRSLGTVWYEVGGPGPPARSRCEGERRRADFNDGAAEEGGGRAVYQVSAVSQVDSACRPTYACFRTRQRC